MFFRKIFRKLILFFSSSLLSFLLPQHNLFLCFFFLAIITVFQNLNDVLSTPSPPAPLKPNFFLTHKIWKITYYLRWIWVWLDFCHEEWYIVFDNGQILKLNHYSYFKYTLLIDHCWKLSMQLHVLYRSGVFVYISHKWRPRLLWNRTVTDMMI